MLNIVPVLFEPCSAILAGVQPESGAESPREPAGIAEADHVGDHRHRILPALNEMEAPVGAVFLKISRDCLAGHPLEKPAAGLARQMHPAGQSLEGYQGLIILFYIPKQPSEAFQLGRAGWLDFCSPPDAHRQYLPEGLTQKALYGQLPAFRPGVKGPLDLIEDINGYSPGLLRTAQHDKRQRGIAEKWPEALALYIAARLTVKQIGTHEYGRISGAAVIGRMTAVRDAAVYDKRLTRMHGADMVVYLIYRLALPRQAYLDIVVPVYRDAPALKGPQIVMIDRHRKAVRAVPHELPSGVVD